VVEDAKSALRAVIATKKLPVHANCTLEQIEKVTQSIETEILQSMVGFSCGGRNIAYFCI